MFRNLGTVDKVGHRRLGRLVADQAADALCVRLVEQVEDQGQHPDRQLRLRSGTRSPTATTSTVRRDRPSITRSCAFTAGNRESGAPKYTYGFSALGTLGPVDLGVTAKRTGPRFIFDNNAAMFAGDIGVTTPTAGRLQQFEVFGTTAPAYWLVNLDARLNLDSSSALKKTYFQLNVYNLFDKFYVGGFGGGLAQSLSTRTCNTTSFPACASTTTVPTWGNPPFVSIGAPRTVSGSLSISF